MNRRLKLPTDRRGLSQGVAIILVLAFGLFGLSMVYLAAREDAYADTGPVFRATVNRTVNTNATTNDNLNK